MLFAGASWSALTASRNPLPRIPGAAENPPAATPLLSGSWWAHPYEINAARRLPVLAGDLLAVDFAPNGRDGWILGRGNLLLRTTNGGETWRRVTFELNPPAPYDPTQSSPTGAPRKAALGSAMFPLATIQLAGMPEPQKPTQTPANQTRRDVQNQAPRQTAPNLPPPTNLSVDNDVKSVPNAAAPSGKPVAPAKRELTTILFRNERLGFGLVNGDKVWATEDGGNSWAPLSSNEYSKIQYELQQNASTRKRWGLLTWEVTSDGQIRCDGKWLPRVFGNGATPLTSIAFVDTSRAWVVGHDGRVLRTVDAGRSWYRASLTEAEAKALGPYIWFPPPLYALALLGVVSLMVVGWQLPDRHVEHRSSIQDILLSDRPLAPGEPDVLGFNSLALGLSAFLRNPRTEPPLTIAITGAWGSGKSSLMNLLRGDLERHGIRPVWFNAWHHQTEEHLLAALLENIRSQAVPGWLSDGGFMFRWRLLMTRLRNDWARWALIGGVFVFSAGFVATSDRFSIDGVLQLATRMFAAIGIGDEAEEKSAEHGSDQAKKKEEANDPAHRAASETASALLQPSGLIAVASLLAGVLKLITAMRAFAAKPSSLLLSQSPGLRLKDLGEQTSFRYHFAREFDEVTSALGARRMVIFIDDLDRCQPKEIYEMLESTNFLVSCGSCFVVLGLARERIERAIGLVFKDIAEFEQADWEDAADADKAEPALSETEKQRRFAEQYLEKLINIEVPVPQADEASYHRLFEARQAAETPQLRDRLARGLSQGWPVIALLGAIVILGVAGLVIGEKARPELGGKVGPVASTVAPASGGPVEATPQLPETPASFIPGSVWSPTASWFAPGVALLVAMALWRLNSRPAVMVMDSAEFSKALDRYLPALAKKPGTTPRSLKRFVNRVRYYAMMQRAQEPERTQWEAFVDWLGRLMGRRPTRAPQAAPLPTPAPAAEDLPSRPERSPDSAPAFPPQASPAPAAAATPPRAPVLTGSLVVSVEEALKLARKETAKADDVVVPESDLVALSALKDWGLSGDAGKRLAQEAASISPAVRAKFEKLRAGVRIES